VLRPPVPGVTVTDRRWRAPVVDACVRVVADTRNWKVALRLGRYGSGFQISPV
jgi:hypothetical protein